MKAIHLMGYGEPADNLELRRIDGPGSPGRGQALIQVEYAPINFNDLMVPRGIFPWKPEAPAVIGNEGAGVVTAVGQGVANVSVGDRVVLPLIAGSWREGLLVPSEGLVPIPPDADPQQVAMLGINATTAHMLLNDFVDLKPGDAVAYNAANSGLARWLIVLAQAMGVRTIGLIRRPDDIEKVERIGCDIVIADDEPIEKAKKRLDGLNIRLGLDVVTGRAAARLIQLLSPGATLVNYGSVTGKPLEIPAPPLTFAGITIRGFFVGLPQYAGKIPALLGELGPILAQRKVEQPISGIYSLDDFKAAIADAEAGKRVLFQMRD